MSHNNKHDLTKAPNAGLHDSHDDVRPKTSVRDLGHWWTWICLTLAGVLTAAGPFLLRSGASREPTDNLSITLVVFGVLCLLMGVTLGILNQVVNRRHSKTLEERRASTVTEFGDALSSMNNALDRLIKSDQGPKDVESFFDMFVSIAPRLLPYQGVRVCIYEYGVSDDPDEADAEAFFSSSLASPQPIETLTRFAYHGRGDEPRMTFLGEDEEGRALIAVAKGKSYLAVDDYKKPPVPIDRPAGRTWVSYLAIPLKFNRYPLGVVTIDTRDQQTFTQEDVSIGWVISGFATLGMTLRESGGRNTQPEADGLRALLRRNDPLS